MAPPTRMNVQKALKQKMAGMSYSAIAKAQGVGKSTVHQMLQPLLDRMLDEKGLEIYRAKQADIIDSVTARTLASITDEKLANSSAKDLIVGSAVLIDKSRLIQGQATSLHGVSVILQGVQSAGAVHGTAGSGGDVIEAEVLE